MTSKSSTIKTNQSPLRRSTRISSQSSSLPVSTTRRSPNVSSTRNIISSFQNETFFEDRIKKLNFKDVVFPDNMTIKDIRYVSNHAKNISSNVEADKTPHFPIVSKFDLKNRKYSEEKSDGSFRDFIKKNGQNFILLRNMLQQILISILTLHHFGIRKQSFTDIDLDQLTFHHTNNKLSENKYFCYKIFGDKYYIQDCGFLWIFSAIDEIEDNQYKNSLQKIYEEDEEDFEDEYQNLLHFLIEKTKKNQIKNEKFKDLLESLLLQKSDVIDSLDKEVTFFQSLLENKKLFIQPHSVNQNNLSNSKPYTICKTKLTFIS
jgi:hypothetical protein